MEIHTSTAAPAPDAAAAATADPRPVTSPHTTEITTIPVQSILIAIFCTPSFIPMNLNFLYTSYFPVFSFYWLSLVDLYYIFSFFYIFRRKK